MKAFHRLIIVSGLLFFISMAVPGTVFAQCAMCKAAVESSESGLNKEGLNAGIFYLASVSYVLMTVVAILWYRHSKSYTNRKEKVSRIIRDKLKYFKGSGPHAG